MLSYAHKKLGHGSDSVAAALAFEQYAGTQPITLLTLMIAQTAAAQYDGAKNTYARAQAHSEFVRGAANPRQLWADMSVALAMSGQRVAAKQLFDVEHLLSSHDIELPIGYASTSDFNQALLTAIDADAELDFSGISLSCHGGDTSGDLFAQPQGPVAELACQIRAAAHAYQQQFATMAPDSVLASHPWLTRLPALAQLELRAWSSSSDSVVEWSVLRVVTVNAWQ